jgi:hypothetical protein
MAWSTRPRRPCGSAAPQGEHDDSADDRPHHTPRPTALRPFHPEPPGATGTVTLQFPAGAGSRDGGGLPRTAASPAATRNATSGRPCWRHEATRGQLTKRKNLTLSLQTSVVALSVFFPVVYCARISTATVQSDSRGAAALAAEHAVARPGLGVRQAPPIVFIGLKLAAGIALATLLVAEILAAKTGIGYLIWQSWLSFHVDRMYVGIALAGLIGSLLWLALSGLEWLVVRRLAFRPATGGVPVAERDSESERS